MTLNSTSQKLLKIEDISKLGWLCNTLSILEPFPAVICDGLLSCPSKATIKHIACNECTSPTLTGITVDNSDILLIPIKKVFQVHAQFSQKYKSWAMVIFPLVNSDIMVE